MDARPEVVVRARADVVGRADFAGPLGSAAKDVGRSKIEVGSANERSREAPGGRGCSEVALAAPRADDDRAPGGDAPPGGGRARSRSWGTFFFGMARAAGIGGVKAGRFFRGTYWDAGRPRERYEV